MAHDDERRWEVVLQVIFRVIRPLYCAIVLLAADELLLHASSGGSVEMDALSIKRPKTYKQSADVIQMYNNSPTSRYWACVFLYKTICVCVCLWCGCVVFINPSVVSLVRLTVPRLGRKGGGGGWWWRWWEHTLSNQSDRALLGNEAKRSADWLTGLRVALAPPRLNTRRGKMLLLLLQVGTQNDPTLEHSRTLFCQINILMCN